MRISGIVSKAISVWMSLSFVAVGILFIVVSILAMRAPKVDFATAKAVIVDIQEDYDFDIEEYTYQVFVDYRADGNTYKHAELGSYDSSMKIGDKVDIEYEIGDPTHIQTPGSGKIVYITLGVGILAVLFGTVMTVKRFAA